MGRVPQAMYNTDTETENTSSSNENLKKKRKPSILKYTSASAKKRKCKMHSISEPESDQLDRSDSRERNSSRGKKGKKLRGILKNSVRQKERYSSSSEEDTEQDYMPAMPPNKFLVGRVPLPAGSKPCRGGGVALLVRKANKEKVQPKQTSSSSKKSTNNRRLARKRSY